jgi:hypothetical protein
MYIFLCPFNEYKEPTVNYQTLDFYEKKKMMKQMQSGGTWLELKLCVQSKQITRDNKLLFSIQGEPHGSLTPEHSWKSGLRTMFSANWRNIYGRDFHITYKMSTEEIIEYKIIERATAVWIYIMGYVVVTS